MAAPNIDESFVRQFESEVHEAYQRQGSKLRNTVRTRNNVGGSSTTFQKIGTGIATTKARHGPIPPMNLDPEPVECVLSDWYAGEWIDKLDELKQEHSERRVAVNAGAWALGRKTDEQIIAALDATTSSIAASASGLTKAKIYEAFETLGQDFRADPVERLLQLREAPRPEHELAHDEQRPALADQLHGERGATGVFVPLSVTCFRRLGFFL